MILVMLGPPGVGKGTQGAVLAEDLGWERLVTGDLLRSARREGTELGRRAEEYMERGDLVPDDVIVAMIREHLEALGPSASVIFDGFPRTAPQARSLESMLAGLDRRIDGVLFLTAPDEVLIKRISGRRSCPDCGALYNVHFDPPAEEGICDRCGSRLVHRDDDDESTVAHRLRVYRDQTEPLVEFYRERDVLITVDGDRGMDEVRKAIARALDEELDLQVDRA